MQHQQRQRQWQQDRRRSGEHPAADAGTPGRPGLRPCWRGVPASATRSAAAVPAATGAVAADAARAGGPHRPGGLGACPGHGGRAGLRPGSGHPYGRLRAGPAALLLHRQRTPIWSPRGSTPQFGFVLTSALTFLPAMAGRVEAIRAAQEARGLVVGGGVACGLAAGAGVQMVPLVLGLIKNSGAGPRPSTPAFGSPGPDRLPGARGPAPVPGRPAAARRGCRGTPALVLLAGWGLL